MNAVGVVIHFDPIFLELLPFLTLLCFAAAGPFVAATAVVLAVRRRTRRIGVIMLVSGLGGYACVAVAVALRIRVYPRFPSYGAPADWIASSLICGLAGFTAFVIFAVMFYFRSPMGLTKRSSEPLTGAKIST